MNRKIYYPLLENKQIIDKMFGTNFMQSIIDDTLTPSKCLDANEYLAIQLYGNEIYNYLKQNNAAGIMDIVYSLKSKYKQKMPLFEGIPIDDIALLIVRPECVGLVDKYIEFANKIGLSLIYKKKAQINFEQYLLMYYHGLIPKESRCDFPTRTLNYINKDCYILLFCNNINLKLKASDYLISFKGKQGVKKNNTLRGSIAYDNLKELVTSDGKYFNDNNCNLYFDPIGMCRLLVRENINSDGAHRFANLPLLYYTGQAVHVPNSSEIQDDMSVLLDEKDFDLIKQKIKKKSIN